MNSICRVSCGAGSGEDEGGSENPPKLFGPAWLSVDYPDTHRVGAVG